MIDLQIFNQIEFIQAIKSFFKELNVPMNSVSDEPTTAKDILQDFYKNNSTFQLIDNVYFAGMIDDAAFAENQSLDPAKIKSDYDGILVFGITLNKRNNDLLPTRSQLAEISRAFNRAFYFTPVVVIFKYGKHLAFANTERLKYKQEWREGEKAGKVSLLRDINIEKTHSGHKRILKELRIPTSGTKKVDSFSKLYTYWQEVFSVSLLNKKFYEELSNWYFWAISEVKFPNEPFRIDFESEEKFEEAINEHNGKNVIRLLTRILFVWFIKEKGLIPKEIFDEDFITEELIEDFEPQKPQGAFATGKHTSKYYRAILQNLFFATLNCEKGKRQFRRDGDHQNVTYLMRYKTYFKNYELFLEIMEKNVPFMNGGLFDCLDKAHPDKRGKRGGDIIIYQDGFSDKIDNVVSVPDYLFFDKDEMVDLSKAYGQTKYKKVNTKGLLKILESYKFTITENTPIEEDVALDPELLGRVFENLLASYNPETKTTARKQTGSFYTPREIVNYMVDESLISYLKNKIPENLWGSSGNEIDTKLHELMSFESDMPFNGDTQLKKEIIKAIDNCKILDPACGSGAFPMGILQKMVHVLHKIDPKNEEWQQRQIDRIDEAIESLNQIEDAEYRDKTIKELKEQKKDIKRAFENNELDYGRKLYLIENCIYGVDIQSIAVQISKLRFFISLIVDQNIDKDQENFGIRPLPNLETKFVAANTLIGIAKQDSQLSVFDNEKVKELEQKIKSLNKKLFSIKSPSRKRELREDIKSIRNQMTDILEDDGLDNKTARILSKWDPFDQNSSSPFFDSEWMFDIKDGFDVVIGNPPYILIQNIPNLNENIKKKYLGFKSAQYKIDLYHLFIEKGINLLSKKGIISYITPNTFIKNKHNNLLREVIYKNCHIETVVLFYSQVFESVSVDNLVFVFKKTKTKSISNIFEIRKSINDISESKNEFNESGIQPPQYVFNFDINDEKSLIVEKIEENSYPLNHFGRAYFGIQTYDRQLYVSNDKKNESWRPVIDGGNVFRYRLTKNIDFVHFSPSSIKSGGNPEVYLKNRIVVRQIGKYPEGAYCPKGIYTLNTIYNIYLNNDQISLEFLLAQINSPVTKFYWLVNNFDNKETFPKIKKAPLESIPIKTSNSHEKLLKNLVLIVNNFSDSKFITQIKEVIDALVLDLHFHEHMKERDINILGLVEQDIDEVMQCKEFEQLNNAEKEKVIDQLHTKWSHPDNEVNNRIKLFAVRSPEILKPILES